MTSKDAIELIEAVRPHTLLYNKFHKDYKDNTPKGRKHQIWVQIAKELKADDVRFLKNRWRNLKDNYIKYKKRSDITMYQKYKNWPWAKRLQFLDKYYELETDNELTPKSKKAELLEEGNSNEVVTEETSSTVVSGALPEDIFQLHTTTDIPMDKEMYKKEIIFEDDEDDDEASGTTDNLELKQKNDFDDIDYLMLNYAGIMKKMPKIMQIEMKLNLARLFADAEMANLKKDIVPDIG